MQLVHKQPCLSGYLQVYEHNAESCHALMRFAVFTPTVVKAQSIPNLIVLPDLYDDHLSFFNYSGILAAADTAGLQVFCADTSPRIRLPDDDAEYGFGLGASYYIDSLQQPWAEHYQMYRYLQEWQALLLANWSFEKTGVMGYGMGGHGALLWAAREPDHFTSLSALNPICALSQSEVGKTALSGYLGITRKKWLAFDAVEQLRQGHWQQPIYIDQAETDSQLLSDRKPELLHQVCAQQQIPLNLKIRLGFQHSAFFVQSFIKEHVHYHVAAWNKHQQR